VCSNQESEQTGGLAELERHSDPGSDYGDEKIMGHVSPKGAIAYNFVYRFVELFISDQFHVPGYCI